MPDTSHFAPQTVGWRRQCRRDILPLILTEAIETRGHSGRDGVLNLSVSTTLPDADEVVVVRVTPLSPVNEVDAQGWPGGFFERVAGSMHDLERPPQGNFEERHPLA